MSANITALLEWYLRPSNAAKINVDDMLSQFAIKENKLASSNHLRLHISTF